MSIKEAMEKMETQAKDLESIQTFLTVAKIGNDEALALLRAEPEVGEREELLQLAEKHSRLRQIYYDRWISAMKQSNTLANNVVDMSHAIIGWREKVSFNSEDDLIGELERMVGEALKLVPKT